MSDDPNKEYKLPVHWSTRFFIGCAVYFAVAIPAAMIGINLLGFVFSSGPLFGRVSDVHNNGIPGAFVAYEWEGRSYHGSTGCLAATLTRTGPRGNYFVPWQGWRLLFVWGWTIGPRGPDVWAPGYVRKRDANGRYFFVAESEADEYPGELRGGYVDKGSCFGWMYHNRRVELYVVGFNRSFAKTCGTSPPPTKKDLEWLRSSLVGVASAVNGDDIHTSASTATLSHKFTRALEKIAWANRNDPSVEVTPEQRDEFCASIKNDFLALGESLDED